jgi:RNA polymerase sigma-70 factor (ECF subfamily)
MSAATCTDPAQVGPAARTGGERFEQQVLVYRDELSRAALRLTRNRQDAEDLVQDTYLRAFRSFGQFQPGSNVRAWLFRILMNGYVDARRAFAHRPQLERLDGDELTSRFRVLADRQPGVEEQVLAGFELELLRSALSALPGQFGQAVQLADFEDRPYGEVAALTGVPRNTVGSRVSRGRALLRERLGGSRQELAAS